MNNTTKEIILITTEGCEGCAIMRNSIKQAIALTKKEGITYKEYDFKAVNDNTIKFTDFPTVVFKKDGRIVRKEVGTKPYIVVLRWIDISFK